MDNIITGSYVEDGIKITDVYDLNNPKDKEILQGEIKDLAEKWYDLYLIKHISKEKLEEVLCEIGYYDERIFGE